MSEDRRGTRSVAHPILRLEVIGPDGSRQSTYRVFCRSKQEAIPVGTCASCIRCEGIDGGAAPVVRCAIEAERAEPSPDPLGLHTPVGVVIREGTSAVRPETTLRDALGVLRAEDRRSVVVVDADQVVLGVVYETQHGTTGDETVATRMSSRLSLRAMTPVRRALELMAAAHLREVVVVDENDVPLGIFRDIEGLRWIVAARDA